VSILYSAASPDDFNAPLNMLVAREKKQVLNS